MVSLANITNHFKRKQHQFYTVFPRKENWRKHMPNQFMKLTSHWNPTQTKTASENQANISHGTLNKILGTQIPQHIRRITPHDQVNVTPGNARSVQYLKNQLTQRTTQTNWKRGTQPPRQRQKKCLTNFNVSIRKRHAPGLGPRSLTPVFWLQLAWGRPRREVLETRASGSPPASAATWTAQTNGG